MSDPSASRERDGRSILRRVGQEAGAPPQAGREGDKPDWAELWGTRIGRALGVVLTLGILVWLVAFVFGGG